MNERWCIGGKTSPSHQFKIEWTNGKTVWDSEENLLEYPCCRKLLEARPKSAELSEEDANYTGKIKIIFPEAAKDHEVVAGGCVMPDKRKKPERLVCSPDAGALERVQRGQVGAQDA